MPLYDYKCPECGRVEEVFVRASTQVPHCCHFIMVRQASAPAVVNVKGFSSVNGYSRTDTGWQQSGMPGIKTRVSDGGNK